MFSEQSRNVVGVAQTFHDFGRGRPFTVGPLAHSTGFLDGPDVGHELGSKDVPEVRN